MELDISKLDRLEKLNCCKHYWSNVPMEIYISNEENKLLTIRDNNNIIWQSNDNYCKFLYCYHNSKQITLLQLIILFSNNKHQRLYFSKVNSSVTVTGPTDSTVVPGTEETTGTKDTTTNTTNSTNGTKEAPFGSVVGASTLTEEENSTKVSKDIGTKETPFGAVTEETTGTVGASTVTGKWIQIDNDILYNEINKLSEILPRNESEMERWTLNSNIEKFIPKMKPKYFAVDLDRTFLIHNSKKMIENIKSFEYLRNNNFIPFFCTGRSFESKFDGFKEIMLKYSNYKGYPGIYNNGAIVYDINGNIIKHNYFSKDYMKKLIKYILENKLENYFLFHDLDGFYCLSDPYYVTSKLYLFYEYTNNIIILPEELIEKKILMIYFGKFEVEFGPFTNGKDHIGNFTLYELFVEIVPPNTSKCSGVKCLMDYYHLDNDMIYFVGDGNNDIEIMQMLNNSFAVLNAPDRVKQFAKYILPKTHNNNAVQFLFNLIYQYIL